MRLLAAGVLAVALAGAGWAQDGSLKAELADLKAKIAALESAQAGTIVSDSPESVVSMRKTGAVTIGGNVKPYAVVQHYDRGAPLIVNRDTAQALSDYSHRNDKVVRSNAFTQSADLYVKVDVSANTEMRIRLDLDDSWHAGDLQQDDFLREMYFDFKNILCSPFGARIGKMEVPRGLNKDDLLLSPYVNGGTTDVGFVSPGWQGGSGPEGNVYNMMDNYGNAKITDVFGAVLYGKPTSWLSFEAMLFQDRQQFAANTFRDSIDAINGTRSAGSYSTTRYGGRSLFNSRTNDDMAFKSMAAKVKITPFENFDVVLSVINRYNGAAENYRSGMERFGFAPGATPGVIDAYYNPRYNRNWQMYSGGIDWKLPFCTFIPIEVFAQYQRGEDNGFMADNHSDDIYFGAIFTLREGLRLNLMGEWMQVHSANWNYDQASDSWDSMKNRYWRAQATIEYDLQRGPTLEAGWQGEWYKRTSDYTVSGRRVNDFTSYGNVWYAGVKYEF